MPDLYQICPGSPVYLSCQFASTQQQRFHQNGPAETIHNMRVFADTLHIVVCMQYACHLKRTIKAFSMVITKQNKYNKLGLSCAKLRQVLLSCL